MHQKGIVTLAAAILVLFLLTSGYEAELFFLRFYQAAIYLAIILLFFYFEDRWAYMFAMLVPIIGILLNFASGSLGAQFRDTFRLLGGGATPNPAPVLGALITVCGLVLAFLSYRAFRKEISGTPHARSTIWGSLVIVIIYYSVLVYWFTKSAAG